MGSPLGFVSTWMISAKWTKQTVDVDKPERPHGSTNCRRTTLSGHADAPPRNLIIILVQASRQQRFTDPAHPSPHAQQGVGPTSLKQLNIKAYSTKEREEEENREKYFLVSFILEILSAFYRRDPLQEPLISLIKSTYGH
jgi:hypothetical protein